MEIVSAWQCREECVAHGLEDRVIREFEGGCQGKVCWVEERLAISFVSYLWMWPASGYQHVKSRRRVIVDIDREIKRMGDSALVKAYQPRVDQDIIKPRKYIPSFGRIM